MITDKQFSEKLLIVDDSLTNVKTLRRLLMREGYQVRTACNGEEALRNIQDSAPDLIILDILMPGLDGYQVC